MKNTNLLKTVLFFLALSASYIIVFRVDFVCENLANKPGCYGGNLDFRLRYLGIDNSRDYLKHLHKKGNLDQGECHTLAHGIGRQSAKAGFSMIEAMEDNSAFCGWGFFHGVMEGLFGNGAGHGKISQDAYELCNSIPSSDRIGQFNCFH